MRMPDEPYYILVVETYREICYPDRQPHQLSSCGIEAAVNDTLACVTRSSRICDSVIELGLWAVFPSRPDVFQRPLFSSRLPS